MKIAVIPARGGSKRIPRKNIRSFGGKPMISHSIEAAFASQCFDHVIVSTDDEEIASIARDHGAEVPFMRAGSLADDHTGTGPVVADCIRQMQPILGMPELVCCIYATAPFVQPSDIVRGLTTIQHEGSEFALSVTRYAFPIQRAIRVTAHDRIEMLHPEHFHTRSQDLEETFHDAAQFYWGRSKAWLEGTPIFSPASAAIELPRHRVQDIDTLDDWHRAELMWETMQRA